MKFHIVLLFSLITTWTLGAEQGSASRAYFEYCLRQTPYCGVQERYKETVSLESQERNTEGFAAYLTGNYKEAERLWEEAISLDGKSSLACFNLACAKSLLTEQDGEDRSDEIFFLLREAWKREDYWLFKTFLDSDLDAVRGDLKDTEVVQYSPGDFGYDT